MNHAEICARLPHAGNMCLLDRLERWDPDSIVCLARSHRDLANPLRAQGRLHAICSVEYAAQAMALHGSLLSTPTAAPARGYLASARDVQIDVEDLAALSEDLTISARRLGGDTSGFIYEFEVNAGTRRVSRGRLTAKLWTAEASA